MRTDLIIHSARQLLTCVGSDGKPRRGAAMRDLGIIEDGAVAVSAGKIIDVGTTQEILARHEAETLLNARNRVVCPGFIDPHTHVLYAGDRIDEFEMRIQGTSYLEIMAAGGGIASTTRAVRTASVGQLIEETRPRLDQMLRLGTTTAEVKSGYGLDTENELKMLQAVAVLDDLHPIDLIPTFLGAHAIPAEHQTTPDAYVDMVISEMIPLIATWYNTTHFADRDAPLFVDVFCEQNAFDLAQSRQILQAGKAAGMRVKAHVDEFTAMGGLSMAVELGATSVDHLDVTPQDEITVLAESETVGVVIPAVNFNLASCHFADARAMIDAGAAIALCTDINPGSAPCPSMPLVMAIACRYQKLLPAEAMIASTINAAHAIGVGHLVGSIEVNKQADLLVINAQDYRKIAYEFGDNPVAKVVKHGHIIG